MTAIATRRPRAVRKPRRNARGEWRCARCQRYQAPSAFPCNRATGRPDSYCKPCRSAYQGAINNRKALDPAWWDAALVRRAVYGEREKAARRARRQERGDLARVILADLRRKGLSGQMVYDIAHVAWWTQRRIERGGDIEYDHVLQRLAWLQEACRGLPDLPRGRGSPRHPHHAHIAARYQHLRAGATP